MKQSDGMMNKTQSCRGALLEYAALQYGTSPEYLWRTNPDYAVLRHPCGRWFGVVMDVKNGYIGLSGEGCTDILVARCDETLQPFLLAKEGFLPPYHMNKRRWIACLLDGTVNEGDVRALLDMSYSLITDAAGARGRKSKNINGGD